ncbi:DUF305 domain-containing protein [Frigoribacterium sp. CFBP9039]|uniref:DUF305 domain-containing protein n=1 Tax=unclassified Frigoribacterium TaxID=2627005 RepID=UPI001786CA8A|nr:DUF305 domain-containing protein [Frigoribacterium sp. CFBP9039]MBD8702590.1 DUF305 domain-containing protein [Frigoribacterium sp. CFBP 13712]MDY0946171.1 DUF305 domain-containing protein [Frigoribacterium sp. CFBP9039]
MTDADRGGTGAGVVDPTRASRGRRIRFVVAAALSIALVLLIGIAVGRLSSPNPVTPGTESVEAGFSRDMQVHHEQAVRMAMIVRDRTDDPATRSMAYDMALTQSQQAGQMFAWLELWGVPQAPSEPTMTWMSRPTLDGSYGDHEHTPSGGAGGSATPVATHEPGGPMPGLATDEQLAALEAASGVEAERMFLTLMIAHHRGGVEMADAVLARSENRQVRVFATGMVQSQESEIDAMEDMLAERE